MTLGIDRQDIVDGLWAGHARVGRSPVVSSTWAHLAEAGLEFSPSRAAALLEQTGWRDGDGNGVREKAGTALELSAIVNADNRVRREALERVRANLATIGVRFVIEPLPRAEFVARARDKDFDAVISGWWAGTRIEPQNMLHSRAAVGRGNNLGSWSTPESDRLLDQAAAAASREEALPLWQSWQRLFLEEQPSTVLYEETRLLGLNRRVVAPSPSYLNPLQNLHEWSVATDGESP